MNVVVCVKQIPDPAAPQALDASHNLNRSGKLILDEADTYGVEMALQLVDKAGGGEVSVVSMGSAGDVAGGAVSSNRLEEVVPKVGAFAA